MTVLIAVGRNASNVTHQLFPVNSLKNKLTRDIRVCLCVRRRYVNTSESVIGMTLRHKIPLCKSERVLTNVYSNLLKFMLFLSSLFVRSFVRSFSTRRQLKLTMKAMDPTRGVKTLFSHAINLGRVTIDGRSMYSNEQNKPGRVFFSLSLFFSLT